MSKNPFYKKHVVSIADFSAEELMHIVQTAGFIKANPQPDALKGKVIGSCFFEASTRTRLSFETAVLRLGGRIIGFDDDANTSAAKKGETLTDSLKVVTSYADGLIMRHPKEGAARLATQLSPVPIFNGGDGANQHPTQTLLDLFSIFETQGRLDHLNLVFVGDLKYGRTVHSLVQALSKFEGNQFMFVAPDALQMPEHHLEELDALSIAYQLSTSMAEATLEADILYMTRIQKERFDEDEYRYMKAAFILTAEMLNGAKQNLRVLHPLPRVDEIDVQVDETPHAYYFQQAENGVYARQAILALCLNPDFQGGA